jgi:hypothetical protein
MSSSPKQEQLRHLLDEQHASLQHTFPSDKRRSLLALIRAHDWHFLASSHSGLTPNLEGRMECLLIIQAGKRIPEEVLDPDELLHV